MKHPTQLMVCHEPIGERERDKHGRTEYCDLNAAVWCIPCGYYLCDIHALARHEGHYTQTREEEDIVAVSEQHGERRIAQRRQ